MRESIPDLEEKLSMIYGYSVRILGPYTCKDGRKRVDIISSNGKKTAQLARVLLEIKIQRKLIKDETVDHIDGDVRNDSFDNLQVLSKLDNVRKAVKDQNREVNYLEYFCKQCNKKVYRREKYMKLRGGKHVFCSNSCRSNYWKANQYGNVEDGYRRNINV